MEETVPQKASPGPTPREIYTFEVTERLGSVLSLIGTAYIIGTFLTDKSFHKPINRLVFYASWGNIISNIGTLISTSGPKAGVPSPLCQSQAFLVNTFMPADALWTLAMACNVYLTLFYHYDAKKLRALEWKYMVFCYGLPLIPSLAFVLIETESRGKVFGDAVLWCWISSKWAVLRVAAFYGPVWVVIVLTFAIYIWAGKEIFARRRQLRNFSSAASDAPFPVIQNPFLSPFVSVKTTEVRVTSEPTPIPVDARSMNSFVLNDSGRIVSSHGAPDYSVRVEGGHPPEGPRPKSAHNPHVSVDTTIRGADSLSRQHKAAVEANKAAISYCKCALLFFASLLITWVPSSLNRVYSLIYPTSTNFGLLFIASLVLPLQGFWNAVIYIVTTYPESKALVSRWRNAAPSLRKTRSALSYRTTSSPQASRFSSEDSMKAFATKGESSP